MNNKINDSYETNFFKDDRQVNGANIIKKLQEEIKFSCNDKEHDKSWDKHVNHWKTK